MSYEIFDYHAHSIDPKEFISFFKITEEKVFKPHDYLMNHAKSHEENIKQTLEYYEKYNVSLSLISGAHSKYWIEQAPDTFIKSFQPNLRANPEEQLKILEDGIKKGVIKGIGELGLAYAGLSLDTELLYPYYEVCEKNNIPVLFHTGLNGPQASQNVPIWRVKNANPILLEPVISSFPKLRFVMAHFGFPFVNETIYMLSTYKYAYADLSVLNWMLGETLYHRILIETIDTVGSDRLLYGSDQMIWPQVIETSIKRTLRAPLEDEDLKNILHQNAVKLLQI